MFIFRIVTYYLCSIPSVSIPFPSLLAFVLSIIHFYVNYPFRSRCKQCGDERRNTRERNVEGGRTEWNERGRGGASSRGMRGGMNDNNMRGRGVDAVAAGNSRNTEN